jgi:transcriptional regulator GlxA family with amidase domain
MPKSAPCHRCCAVSEMRVARCLEITQPPIGTVRFEAGKPAAGTEPCGFSNQAHFATCYRRRFGVTPREARGLATLTPA